MKKSGFFSNQFIHTAFAVLLSLYLAIALAVNPIKIGLAVGSAAENNAGMGHNGGPPLDDDGDADDDGIPDEFDRYPYDDFDALAVGNCSDLKGVAFISCSGFHGAYGGAVVHGGANSAPNNVPGGGLRAHENAGGHLIDRHVGKTDQQLTDRLNSQPNISAASSFPDEATADRAVGSAISGNQSQVDAFANGAGGNRLVINYDTGSNVGSVMQRGNTSSTPTTSVRVVLQRDPNMPDGYRIITGFPTP